VYHNKKSVSGKERKKETNKASKQALLKNGTTWHPVFSLLENGTLVTLITAQLPDYGVTLNIFSTWTTPYTEMLAKKKLGVIIFC
jgi:hypothetical protein